MSITPGGTYSNPSQYTADSLTQIWICTNAAIGLAIENNIAEIILYPIVRLIFKKLTLLQVLFLNSRPFRRDSFLILGCIVQLLGSKSRPVMLQTCVQQNNGSPPPPPSQITPLYESKFHL